MISTNLEFLRPEIMDMLRAFGMENEDFTHYFSYSGGKFFNVIEYRSLFYDFEDLFDPADDVEFKRLAKRTCKLAFYKVISSVTGKKLPWGALTGIRPTKMAFGEIDSGRDFEKLFATLEVSRENIALVKKIVDTQKPYRGGGKSLYVSLPFCPSKCDYCSFVTAPVSKTEKYVDGYIDCLVKEIESVGEFVSNVRSVYIGGGTPFVLSEDRLKRVYDAVKSVLPSASEYTVEAGRPDVFTEGKLALSKEYGVNRICVNPQSFNDKTLEAIGRNHTAARTFEAYRMAEKYGFDINIDLIAGLADETCADFEKSAEAAIALNPANITVHTLCLKSGAKLKESVKSLNVAGISDMIALSRERLSAAGYVPYYLYRQKYQAGGSENVGWCKPGKECLYNIDVMEELDDNIAVGAGAISKRVFKEDGRIERCDSPKDIPSYIAKSEQIIRKRVGFFR